MGPSRRTRPPMSEVDDRWRLNVEWMDESYQLFMQNQLALGRSESEALALLKSIWAREDRERLEALRRVGQVTMRAR